MPEGQGLTREMYDAPTREWVPLQEYLQRQAARMVKKAASPLPMPYTFPDTPDYVSPVGTGLTSGRVQRRDDLKRSDCREVDPGEYTPKYTNPKFARKGGKSIAKE